MGNRLTLPLLLLAALLAGGAFFWLTGGERRGPAPHVASEPTQSTAPGAAPELAKPAAPPGEARPAGPEPARVVASESAAPKPAAKPSGEGVGVSGRILDPAGAPVAGARVTLAANTGFPLDLELDNEFPWLQRQRAETDADGRYRFARVEPGAQQMLVCAGGFAPHEEHGLAVPKGGVEFEPITLVRGAILSGIVVDPDGRGVGGARLVRDEIDRDEIFMLGAREPVAVTEANGRFRIDQVACGAWRFVVRSEEHPDLVVEGVAEQPLETAGLRWQLAPGATITGTVTGIPAGERDELEVRASRGGGEGFLQLGSSRVAKVGTNGAFALHGLDVGQEYALQARRDQAEGELGFFERSRSNSVHARSGDSGVVLEYQPEAALTFSVFDARTRAPLERFTVESGLEWPVPLADEGGRARTAFPGGVVRVGGLRPSSDQERVQLKVHATGYADYRRNDIAVRAGQELDLGVLYLEPVPVVRVRVRDAATNAPVADATVRMQRAEQGGPVQFKRALNITADEAVESIEFGDGRSATTDAEGWAELTAYEGGGTVNLSAKAKGYAPAEKKELVLPAGESVEQELRLTLGGEVLVHVVDAQGVALKGARVEHRSNSGAGPHEGLFVLGGGGGGEITDSNGEVLFPNLAPGLHSFRLGEDSGGGGGLFSAGSDVAIAIPGMGGGDDDDWSQVQVGDGARSEVTLRAAPRGALTGRVREAGKVLAGATLRLSKAGEDAGPHMPMMMGMGGGPEGKSDGDGRYAIEDVKEGVYKLSVTHPTRRMPQEFELELKEGKNTFDVDLSLAILSGRVVDEKHQGLPGVKVWAERKSPSGASPVRMRFMMVSNDDGGGGVVDSGQFGERATTDAEGRYTLRGVTADADLVVKAEGDAVQPGQSEVVRLAPNQVMEGVDVALLPAGTIHVEAKLRDGAPARFQLVQAEYVGSEEPRPEPKVGFLQEGSTELKGLRPGRWRVNVKPAGGGPRSSDPGQDQELEVKPGETTNASYTVD